MCDERQRTPVCRTFLFEERSRSATVTEEKIELTLPSRIEAIAEAAAKADEVAGRLQLSEDAAFGLDMAVREAVPAMNCAWRRSPTCTMDSAWLDAGWSCQSVSEKGSWSHRYTTAAPSASTR